MQFSGFDITRGFLLSATFQVDVVYSAVGPIFGTVGTYVTDPVSGLVSLTPSPTRGAATLSIDTSFTNTDLTGSSSAITLDEVETLFGIELVALQSGHTGVAIGGDISSGVTDFAGIDTIKSGSTVSVAVAGLIATNAEGNSNLDDTDEAFAHAVVTLGEVEYTYFAINRVQGMSDGNDTLNGTTGEDFIEGRNGNDRLFGNAAADTLLGGLGNDLLDGGTGSDVMSGGLGNDRYYIDSSNDVIINEIGFSKGGGIDTVYAYVDYQLGANTEILRLIGDTDIDGSGNFAPESLVGNSGDNQLDGSGGNDRINGKDGDDVLIGGAGADTLVGEAGADIFRFNAVSDSRAGAASRDFINGFVTGEDRINLSQIDANSTLAGNQAFSFVGDSAFSGSAGELRFFTFGGGNYNIVEVDVNGDRIADMQIFVNLTNQMVSSDFIL
jgi:Ca2+-binding RTX toxin-like protein